MRDNCKLTPKLRFPDFRKGPGWDVRFVGDMFAVTRGEVLAMTLVQDQRTEKSPYPVYSSQTKNNGLAGYYSDFLYENAITWTTDGANAGDVNYRPGKFYCTNVCGVLLSDEGYANPCIAYLLNGVTRKHVSYVGNPKLMNGVMAKIAIPIPSPAEQQKIAVCLSSLDDLIAAEGRNLESLRAYKKGLMQQLFPRDGESVPRLRFPEFHGAREWEEGKLGKYVDIWSGGSPSQYALALDGDYPFVKVEDLNNCVKYQVTGREFCDDADRLVPRQSILFPKRGAAIELNKIRITTCEILIDTNLMAITPKDGLTAEFLFYYVSNVGLAHIADTSSIPQINNKHIIPFAFLLPSTAEQQRIATCLSSLDELITVQSRKVECLKAHKKGLMQQLFPSAGGAER